MNIDRKVPQGSQDLTLDRLKYCLDLLEEDEEFAPGMTWGTGIVSAPGFFQYTRLTLEELIGALVAVEQTILNEIRLEQLLSNPEKW